MRARDKATTKSSSTGLEEVRVNDHVKIVDKVKMFSKEPNMQASVEEGGDTFGEYETRT